MKVTRLGFTVLAAAVAVLGFGGVYAFHAGGVAECSGCHSMHSPGSSPLLVRDDASSTCLDCHEGTGSYHILTPDAGIPAGDPPDNYTPGGDFAWLKKTTSTRASYGAPISNPGETHGHNVVATNFSLVADLTNTTAPFGTMDAADLKCISCHDPHGKARELADGSVVYPTRTQGTTYAPIFASGSYPLAGTGAVPTGLAVGIYRLLGGNGYQASGSDDAFNGAPRAIVPSGYNRTEGTTQTRTAYGWGAGWEQWGDWCATCHPNAHTDNAYVHPVDAGLTGGTAANYNMYVKTGDLTGTTTNSFLSLISFAQNEVSRTALDDLAVNNDTQLGGPTSAERVMCLSCHRAHASAWEYSLRWNPEGEFLTMSTDAAPTTAVYPATDAVGNAATGTALSAYGQFHRGYSTAEMTAAYYGRAATKFAPFQRSLCNKCHIQD